PLRRPRSDAAVLHRAPLAYAARVVSERYHPCAARDTAIARRMRLARTGLRVLLLQQIGQDTAGGVRDLDALVARGASKRVVAARERGRSDRQLAAGSGGGRRRPVASDLRAQSAAAAASGAPRGGRS